MRVPDAASDGDVDVDGLLTADRLTAFMKATWTWDDRALRREVSELLLDVEALRALAAGSETAEASAVEIAEASAVETAELEALRGSGVLELAGRRLQARAAQFCATVLGPRLLGLGDDERLRPFAALALARPGSDAAAEHDTLVAYGRTVASSYRERGPEPTFEAAEVASCQLSTRVLALPLLEALRSDPRAAVLIDSAAVRNDRASVAVAEQGGAWDPASCRARAQEVQGSWSVTGVKTVVPDASSAELLLVLARTTAGPSIFAVPAPAPGLVCRGVEGIDRDRDFGEVVLDATPATPLGRDGAGAVVISHLLDQASLALAQEQLALARACLALSSAAAGSAVGLAQIAELHVDLVAAAALARAATALPAPPQPWRVPPAGAPARSSTLAHIACSRIAVAAARHALRWRPDSEDAERLLRRSMADEVIFGGPSLVYERLLDRFGI